MHGKAYIIDIVIIYRVISIGMAEAISVYEIDAEKKQA